MNILEILYYLGYKASKGYKSLKKSHLKYPVISVGNITLGGTGKTPAVIAIAQEALKRGFKPCVLTRGYRGKIKKPVIVSRGNGALYNSTEAGDEAVVMSERLKGVEVIKSANRHEGGLLSRNANLFIVDDGYQHWHLHRDKNILLIDSIDPFGNGRLLPLGRLREPLKEIRRAHAIVITRCTEDDKLVEVLKVYSKDALIYFSTIKPSWLVKQNGELQSVENLVRKRVYAFCGLGNPGGFIQTLLKFGISLVGFKSFRDHHIFSKEEVDTISREAARTKADLIITSEKDLVNISDSGLPDNFAALRIEFDISDDFYDNIFTFPQTRQTHGHGG